ncbi:uncharacterized protein FOMMEDRAFT_147687 [Fomitiporia mediterranea MF3/22]|uniref:uncharacterized protein n=1 Tax=Fomitiporia mediterranea (strain MF3/22) TaxID=694068 RepID=UPI0004408A93|nr:uncharacterized protein FOMMEDRAFT_147687 [Fomitiporia mediterranea MF3/22]EJD01026.1 hypothetical protein FOMMEDRAFT_147687 [Fomitiporia mediterranea MF3/22]
MPVPLSTTAQHNQQQPYSRSTVPSKNVKRKSSKPIINWLQRKLGGTVRARRPSNTNNIRGSADSTYSSRGTSLKELHTAPARGRVPQQNDVDENGQLIRQHAAVRPLSNQISLNSTAETSDIDDDDDDDMSARRSSGVATSMWGSRSNPVEADEDASIRPLPPTSPPSPSPSRSSSSYMSDLRTFRSMSASTKPTTLLSIDLTPGVAHIAQAPPTPTSVSAYNVPNPSPVARRSPHVRTTSSGTSGLVTFSALPPSSPPSSRPSSLGPTMRTVPNGLQAPAHTTHHPRNNPRPSSPPLDNASILTLASSAFATPVGEREYRNRMPTAWVIGADNASHLSHFDGTTDSVSQIILDGDCNGDEPNASVRALRPRSARRDSWESEMSRWSAGVSYLGAFGHGRDRSVRTAPSFRTGGQTLDVDGYDGVSMSLADEDMNSMREDGIEESIAETKDDREQAFSPPSIASVEGASDERAARMSEATETDETSTQESQSHETEDAATPGPAARTLALVPSRESIPMPVRPTTPPSVPVKDVDTTPKKEKEKEKAELKMASDDESQS